MTQTQTYEQQAYERGCEAARRAASWAADGDTSAEHARNVLAWLEAGDPLAEQYLPSRPDLSAEWGGDETPESLVASIVPADVLPKMSVARRLEIIEEWERGVSDTFESACEEELRKHV